MTQNDIQVINADLINEFGGWLPVVPNLKPGYDLNHLVASVQFPVFGVDRYPSVADKAAALAWFIIVGHPFNDTNKRTGMESAIEFLELNGFVPHFQSAEIIQVALAVEAGSITFDDLKAWILRNITGPT